MADEAIVERMAALMESARGARAEMELRLGKFSGQAHFQPGFGSRELANKLVAALQMNSKHKPGWSAIDPVQFVTAQYPGNVRKRVTPGRAQEVVRKTRIGCVDIGSNREFGLRFAVSEEVPASEPADGEPPVSVWVTERASFTEDIALSGYNIRVRFDISMQSQPAANKKLIEEKKADFHCEIEIVDGFDATRSRAIAQKLLDIGRACMGTHYHTQAGKIKMPPPNLFLMK